MNSDGLRLEAVTLSLPGRLVIAPLDLIVRRGEVVTLMGESGCGKSSLLAYLCGSLPRAFSASGAIWNAGVDITRLPSEQRRLGILFQDDLLFPHLSVHQNLAFGLSPDVGPRNQRLQHIESVLSKVGLAGLGDRDPTTLSGGQRARIALIRTLLSEPKALLLDEPFSKLDAVTKQQFREFVFEHLREKRLPTLLVTHDPADAEAAGGATIELQGPSRSSTSGLRPVDGIP